MTQFRESFARDGAFTRSAFSDDAFQMSYVATPRTKKQNVINGPWRRQRAVDAVWSNRNKERPAKP